MLWYVEGEGEALVCDENSVREKPSVRVCWDLLFVWMEVIPFVGVCGGGLAGDDDSDGGVDGGADGG